VNRQAYRERLPVSGNVEYARLSARATTRTAVDTRKRRRAIMITALANLLAGGCASAVKETDRDTSGAFDGRWLGSVEEGFRAT